MLLVSLCSGLFCLPFLPLVGLPASAEYPGWRSHSAAQRILSLPGPCLSAGEFGQVYPLARGCAPLMTLLFGALLLGEVPGGQ